MTFEIPHLGGVPSRIQFGAEPPAFGALARSMAANGFLRDEDLRIGSGGTRLLVEKPLRRWWRDRGLPARLACLPIDFHIVGPEQWPYNRPGGPADAAVLVIDTARAPQRCYLRPVLEPLAQQSPEFVQHAIAVLYAGLDAVCHAITPRELLAFARAYWWEGGEDKVARTDSIMSRRSFNHRVAPIAQAPEIWPPIVYEFVRGQRNLVDAVQAVQERLADPLVLRPNAEAVTGLPPGRIAAIVRWRHGDPAFQLIDHHWRSDGGMAHTADFHSAWAIPTEPRAFQRLLARIEATVRLAQAVNDLIQRIASPAGRMPFFAF